MNRNFKIREQDYKAIQGINSLLSGHFLSFLSLSPFLLLPLPSGSDLLIGNQTGFRDQIHAVQNGPGNPVQISPHLIF